MGKLIFFQTVTPPLDIFSLVKTDPYLVVDTSLYPPEFQAALLTRLSVDLPDGLDAATDGLLIHSDNFQALNLLQARYREQVKCIYIDPPYNTTENGFIYKNQYRHSSWLTMIKNRIETSKKLLSNNGVFSSSIDDFELPYFEKLLDDTFNLDNRLGNLIVEIKPSGRTNDYYLSTSHEYALFYSKNNHACIDFFPLSEQQKAAYSEKTGEEYFKWRDFLRTGGFSTPQERPNSYYPIFYNPNTNEARLEGFVGSIKILPIDSEGKHRVWRKTPPSFTKHLLSGEINFKINRNGQWKIQIIDRIKEGIRPKSVWVNSKYDASSYGTKLLKNLFKNTVPFSFPKSIFTVYDIIYINNASDLNSIVLDYFAGSGTTAHAVINLNREDDGKRKYILVEQAEYFNTVLKPRVQKVIYSKEWKDGKPQADSDGNFHGVSQIVKVLKLESYEDTLNNLQLKKPDLLARTLNDQSAQDYLLHYMLDIESRDSLLSSDDFRKPFDYRLNIASDSAGAYTPQVIDLVETFNYLLGLRVDAVEDRRFDKGYVFVEGHLDGERILLVWRDCERWHDDSLPQLLEKKRINPQDSEFTEIYINGDHTLPTVWQDNDADGGSARTLKIRSIEAEFLRLMFAEAE